MRTLGESSRFHNCVDVFHQGQQVCTCHFRPQSRLCHKLNKCGLVQTLTVKVLKLVISHGAAMYSCSMQVCVILYQTVCLSNSHYISESLVCLSVICCHCSPLRFCLVSGYKCLRKNLSVNSKVQKRAHCVLEELREHSCCSSCC